MSTHRSSLLVVVLLAATQVGAFAEQRAPGVGKLIRTPIVVVNNDGARQVAEEGMIFVKENRSVPNSRIIPVYFLRFPALQQAENQPPIFLLPGGPGQRLDFNEARHFDAVMRMRQIHDVVYVGQRGNPREALPVSHLMVDDPSFPVGEKLSSRVLGAALRHQFDEAQSQWAAAGVDLSGYDILNIVDDVFELRTALGYQKIFLRGCSFGSQWSLAYIKRWPKTVERALLSGVEPLDYAYDDPSWLWAGFARLARMAEQDLLLGAEIPDGGLMEALKEIIRRLKREPASVEIALPGGELQTVVLGALDVQRALRFPPGSSRREQHENWPKFVLEMYRGDYRYLALRTALFRTQPGETPMIEYLIDNSLGVSAARDDLLLSREENDWLGDINLGYRSTRSVSAAPPVEDAFREDFDISVPVLLVNGDIDWSTPVENSEHLLASLNQGHLLRVNGAGHCPIGIELREHHPALVERIYGFLDVKAGFEGRLFEAFPNDVRLPRFAFSTMQGPSLYQLAMDGAWEL